MPETRLVTLLSDFGLSDVYVGVMKGAIAQVNPHLTVVDLTHQIPPQNIVAAQFALADAYPYFPTGTVHVAVVDPGVGSHRRAIALQLERAFLVGPDNGLFGGIFQQHSLIAAVELTNPDYWRTPTPSQTFHGRDIFAPVGAHLASGVPIAHLGEAIEPETLVESVVPTCKPTSTGIAGCIQYVDRFGNLVTNIPATAVAGKTWSVTVGDLIILSSQTYSDAQPGGVVALIGSHGWVELAINGGSASAQLELNWGDPVEVLFAGTH
jgi:hypothetical protein